MTHEVRRTTTADGFTGRHVLAAMLGFFGIIVATDSFLIYQAVSTFGGVDNANAYRDGLVYNQRIRSSEEQQRLGWTDKTDVAAGPVRLRVSLQDRSGATLGGKRVVAGIGRPATTRFDSRLELSEVQPGFYEAVLPAGMEGSWVAEISVLGNDGRSDDTPVYRARRRVWIAP